MNASDVKGALGGPQVTTLDNGLRIVTHNMAHLETVSLGIWVSCGARHEEARDNGISHFLEHMAFKGTARRTAREIAEEIEQVGGDLNAATSLEMTAYYARVLKGDVGLALDVLADILANPSYDEDEIERERDVILQEIAATKDIPDELVYDIIQSVAFPGQAVGRPILGSEENVKRFDAVELRRFLDKNYSPNRLVISAAGAVDHESIVRHAEALFGTSNSGAVETGSGALYEGGVKFLDKSFEQSHMMMAFKAPSYLDPDYFSLLVFSGLFGGGMSSRLFQEVREQRGLCYSIYSSCWGLADAGIFNIHAATSPKAMSELVEVVTSQMRLAVDECPTTREVARAKAQIKAGLLMSLESSSARAEQMARHLMGYGRLLSVAELVEKIDAVSVDSVRDVARAIFTGDKPSFSIVGTGAGDYDPGPGGIGLVAAETGIN